ncbi:hypothetical protein GCM10007063_28640 [Lentibacillus kapialis]|uniref:Uncharacterized protein n=1 Tax=Lentibacillus kapialis TaxID=340214 RepID=A0A917Q1L3_9BACI|nr:hypothetical protein GCM10007063_28640 [Lentibacillus kapialis]
MGSDESRLGYAFSADSPIQLPLTEMLPHTYNVISFGNMEVKVCQSGIIMNYAANIKVDLSE